VFIAGIHQRFGLRFLTGRRTRGGSLEAPAKQTNF